MIHQKDSSENEGLSLLSLVAGASSGDMDKKPHLAMKNLSVPCSDRSNCAKEVENYLLSAQTLKDFVLNEKGRKSYSDLSTAFVEVDEAVRKRSRFSEEDKSSTAYSSHNIKSFLDMEAFAQYAGTMKNPYFFNNGFTGGFSNSSMLCNPLLKNLWETGGVKSPETPTMLQYDSLGFSPHLSNWNGMVAYPYMQSTSYALQAPEKSMNHESEGLITRAQLSPLSEKQAEYAKYCNKSGKPSSFFLEASKMPASSPTLDIFKAQDFDARDNSSKNIKNDIDSKLQLLVLLINEYRLSSGPCAQSVETASDHENQDDDISDVSISDEDSCSKTSIGSLTPVKSIDFSAIETTNLQKLALIEKFLNSVLCMCTSFDDIKDIFSNDSVLDISPLSSLIWRHVLRGQKEEAKKSLLYDLLTKSNLDFSNITGPSSLASVSQILNSLIRLEVSNSLKTHSSGVSFSISVLEKESIFDQSANSMSAPFVWKSNKCSPIAVTGLFRCCLSPVDPKEDSTSNLSSISGEFKISHMKIMFDPNTLLRQCATSG